MVGWDMVDRADMGEWADMEVDTVVADMVVGMVAGAYTVEGDSMVVDMVVDMEDMGIE